MDQPAAFWEGVEQLLELAESELPLLAATIVALVALFLWLRASRRQRRHQRETHDLKQQLADLQSRYERSLLQHMAADKRDTNPARQASRSSTAGRAPPSN